MPNFSFYAGKLLVFLLRRLAAADVALLLVDVEDHPHLAVKRRFDLPQALADVFMHRTLRNPEFAGGLPDGGLVLDYVFPQNYRAFAVLWYCHTLTPNVF